MESLLTFKEAGDQINMTYCMRHLLLGDVQRDAREDIWETELANSPFSVFSLIYFKE